MFGYVKPQKSELLVREYELYRGIYCGLCRTGGKKVSRLTRFFLSYDFTALAALRLALQQLEPSVEKRFCPWSFKRRGSLKCDEVLVYAAAAFACLAYFKARDDVDDAKGLKKLFKKLAMPVFGQMRKRAERLYPTLYGLVSEGLSMLASLEKDGESHTPDALADGFARSVAAVASFELEGTAKAIALEAGYHIGRYIYLADALDDIKSDEKHGLFNPLIRHYGSAEKALSHAETLEDTLKASALRFSAAVGLAKPSVYTDILQNIASFGMRQTVREIYDKHGLKRKESI